METLQYKAAKVVTGALHFTSKDKLNTELGWETIMERGNFLGLNIFQKIHLHETRPLIRSCMPKLDLEQKSQDQRVGWVFTLQKSWTKIQNILFNIFQVADERSM